MQKRTKPLPQKIANNPQRTPSAQMHSPKFLGHFCVGALGSHRRYPNLPVLWSGRLDIQNAVPSKMLFGGAWFSKSSFPKERASSLEKPVFLIWLWGVWRGGPVPQSAGQPAR